MNLQILNDKIKNKARRFGHLAIWDTIIVLISLWLTWSASIESTTVPSWKLAIFSVFSAFIFFWSNMILGLYQRIWKYASAAEIVHIGASVLFATTLLTGVDLLLIERRVIPVSVVVWTGLWAFLGFILVRYRDRIRIWLQWQLRGFDQNTLPERQRVLIVGAGEAGEILARRFLAAKSGRNYHIIGFVDDDRAKHNLWLHDLLVFGDRYKIPELVSHYGIDLIVIAIYNITGEEFRAILEICERTSAQIKVIPDLFQFLQGGPSMPPVRDISAEDLLGRKVVEIDETACRKLLEDKKVLVTGAAGSIGAELCRQILAFIPQRLLMLDNNESGLYELNNSLHPSGPENVDYTARQLSANKERLTTILCSVTNRSKMKTVFDIYRPEIVFHAAAYKHVPLMEEQPDEALWVNVLGTKNLVELAREYEVKRFVFVSTDKAVRPVCIMGATKWLGELMIMNAGSWATIHENPEDTESIVELAEAAGAGKSIRVKKVGIGPDIPAVPLYTAVRFGNVLSSRGSVVPTFERQIQAGGPVMVTHPDMTRYFMSITEAVRLIIQAATFTQGQDIFMLNMGEKIRIDDLARRLIRLRGARPDVDIPIVYTGIRPGEKLHEELLAPKEARQPTSHPCIFRIQKDRYPDAEKLARSIEELLQLGRAQKNGELVEKIQQLVVTEEGEQPDGKAISFKGKGLEMIHSARDSVKTGQLDRALDLYSQALTFSEGLLNQQADILRSIAEIHRIKGEFSKAIELLLESQEVSRRNEYVAGLVRASDSLGLTSATAGNLNLALKHHSTALKLAKLYNYDDETGTILRNIGASLEAKGKIHKAVLAYRRALEYCERSSEVAGAANALLNLGSCYLKVGKTQKAEQYFHQSLTLFRQLDDPEMLAKLYLQFAWLSFKEKQFARATEEADQALQILSNIKKDQSLSEAHLLLGMILRMEKKDDLAEDCLNKALTLSLETNAPLVTAEVYQELALCYMQRELGDKSLQSLSMAAATLSGIRNPHPPSELEKRMESLEMLFVQIAKEFGDTLDRKDPYTEGHCWRVGLYALELSEWVGFSPAQKKALITAAFLHNVGKRKISRDILNKPRSLSAEERQEIKEYVLHSAVVVDDIQFPWPEVLAYVKYHHEHFDGGGYPLRLRGEEIHIGARIIALADYFTALTADRPYRKAFTIQEAVEMIGIQSGKMFDPKLVRIFTKLEFVERLRHLRNQQYLTDLNKLWTRIHLRARQEGGELTHVN